MNISRIFFSLTAGALGRRFFGFNDNGVSCQVKTQRQWNMPDWVCFTMPLSSGLFCQGCSHAILRCGSQWFVHKPFCQVVLVVGLHLVPVVGGKRCRLLCHEQRLTDQNLYVWNITKGEEGGSYLTGTCQDQCYYSVSYSLERLDPVLRDSGPMTPGLRYQRVWTVMKTQGFLIFMATCLMTKMKKPADTI